MSQGLSDILYPYVVPVACLVLMASRIISLRLTVGRLEKENARLRKMIMKHDGVDIFADCVTPWCDADRIDGTKLDLALLQVPIYPALVLL